MTGRPWDRGARAACLCALLCLCGCVFPVPPSEYGRENIADAVPGFIVPGKTTREEVLLALGEPDGESQAQRRFLYYRVSGHGGVGFVFAAGSGGMLASTERETYRRLILEFDADGVVSDARFTRDTCTAALVAVGNAAGESAPCADVSSDSPRQGHVVDAPDRK